MSSLLKYNPNPLGSNTRLTSDVEIDQPTENSMTINARFINADESESSCHFFVKM